jgi:hypothetical protein
VAIRRGFASSFVNYKKRCNRLAAATDKFITGADPEFQVRGGRTFQNFFGVFCVKNHDFTPKNDIFSNCGGRREDCWGISCEKSRFYAKKINKSGVALLGFVAKCNVKMSIMFIYIYIFYY